MSNLYVYVVMKKRGRKIIAIGSLIACDIYCATDAVKRAYPGDDLTIRIGNRGLTMFAILKAYFKSLAKHFLIRLELRR